MAKVTSTAIAPFRETFEKALPAIRSILPTTIAKYLTPERMVKIVLVAMNRNPGLLACTSDSILRCIMDSAELGLELGGPLGHAYLVPFRNSETGKTDAQLIVGYRGYITLARRSGEIQSVESHVIHKNDAFTVRWGTEPALTHVPTFEGEPGAPLGAYVIARFKDGGQHVELMTIAEINKIRARSKAGKSGPWVTDYEEMCRKTVVRRAAKYWPISTELARAIEIDNTVDTGEGALTFDPTTGELAETTAEPDNGKGVKALKAKLQTVPPEQPETDPDTGEAIPVGVGVSAKDRAIDDSEPGLFPRE
jgi:recombination protein RecT